MASAHRALTEQERRVVEAVDTESLLADLADLVATAPVGGEAGEVAEAGELGLEGGGVGAAGIGGRGDTLRELVDGLAHDFERLRRGAALLALGEGVQCDRCDARGLCRRDHWPAAE